MRAARSFGTEILIGYWDEAEVAEAKARLGFS